jgi:hypothetical protein
MNCFVMSGEVETSRDGILKASITEWNARPRVVALRYGLDSLRSARNDRVEQETFIEDLKAQ